MKKLFAFVAAALVAFSFISCEKENMGSKFFKITVSNIEATTADLSIIPADTTLYYGVGIYLAEDVAKHKADTIAAAAVAKIASYVEKGYGLDVLAENGVVFKGKLESQAAGLPANTNLTIVAYQVLEQGKTVVLGEVSYKNFKTKDVEIKETVDLGVLQGGGFEDYRSKDGSYIAYATDMATYDVTLNIYDEDFNGDYTEADLDAEYSSIWTAEMNSEKGLSIAKAELKNVPGNGNDATISGWAVASNGIKYKFSFTYPTVEAKAPKRAAAKGGLKKASLKVVRFNK
jgi:hypothetical protein